MSNFAKYARDNDIHIRGKRGDFARKAAEIWHDVKGKPSWKDNIDIIVPQYLIDVEGFKPGLSLAARKEKVRDTFSFNEYSWWSLKNLYGLWAESIYTNPEVDRLFSIDEEGDVWDITDERDVFEYARELKDEVDHKILDKYSYFWFYEVKENELGGLDVTYELKPSDTVSIHLHKTDSFQWSSMTKAKFETKKEVLEEMGIKPVLGKKQLPYSKALQERDIIEMETKRAIQDKEKLIELNKATKRLDTQFKKGILTKAEYKRLNKMLFEKL